MGIFDSFNDRWNSSPSTSFGQSLTGRKKQNKRPQTMAEWGTYVGGLSRHERSQKYPGMHKDLIPGYEMITGGDPNWGMQSGTGMPSGPGAFGEGSDFPVEPGISTVPKYSDPFQSQYKSLGNFFLQSGFQQVGANVTTWSGGQEEQLNRLREELELIKQDISGVKGEIWTIESRLKRLNWDLKLTFSEERRIEIEAEAFELEEELADLEDQLQLLYQAHNRVSKDIEELAEEISNAPDDQGDWI